MAEVDENDIIISIVTYLRHNIAGNSEITVEYESVDTSYDLPEGSTAKHLETAAKDAGLEIVRKGANKAILRKPSGFAFG